MRASSFFSNCSWNLSLWLNSRSACAVGTFSTETRTCAWKVSCTPPPHPPPPSILGLPVGYKVKWKHPAKQAHTFSPILSPKCWMYNLTPGSSSPGRSGSGVGKRRKACNYVSGIWISPPVPLWLFVGSAVICPPISAKHKRAQYKQTLKNTCQE